MFLAACSPGIIREGIDPLCLVDHWDFEKIMKHEWMDFDRGVAHGKFVSTQLCVDAMLAGEMYNVEGRDLDLCYSDSNHPVARRRDTVHLCIFGP
jgi:hypothetical protein